MRRRLRQAERGRITKAQPLGGREFTKVHVTNYERMCKTTIGTISGLLAIARSGITRPRASPFVGGLLNHLVVMNR